MQPHVHALIQELASRQVASKTVLALAAGLRVIFADATEQIPNSQEALGRVEGLKPRFPEILQFLVARFIRSNMTEFSMGQFENLSESEKDAYRILALQDATTSYTWGEALFSALNLPETFDAWRIALPLTIPQIAGLIQEHFGEVKFKVAAVPETKIRAQIKKFNDEFVAKIKKATETGSVPAGLSPGLDRLKKREKIDPDAVEIVEVSMGGGAICFWLAGLAQWGSGLFFQSQHFWFEGLFKTVGAAFLGGLVGGASVFAGAGILKMVKKAIRNAAIKTLEHTATAIRRFLLQQNGIVLQPSEVDEVPCNVELAKVSGHWRFIAAQGLERYPKVTHELEQYVRGFAQGRFTDIALLEHLASDIRSARAQQKTVAILLHREAGFFLGLRVDETIHCADLGQKNLMRHLLKKI